MKIGEVVRRTPRLLIDEVLIVDDGSTDRSAEVARALGATVLPLGGTIGVGAALRAGYRYAVEHGYDVAVVMAGNNKDAPEENPAPPRPDRRRPGGLRAGLSLPEGRCRLRPHAPLPPHRNAAPPAPLLAGGAPLGDRVDQRFPGRPPARVDRPAAGSLAALAGHVRARALPLPAHDPARLQHHRGAGDEGLPAAPSRPDEDEAGEGLVVDPPPAPLRRPGAPEMIRVAVVGAGQWGPNLIRNFHNRQTSEVVCVIDRDAARLALVRARFPDVQVGPDAEPVLVDPDVDAVVVATPTSTHHRLVKTALEHGKHVLVEKPITSDVDQAEELRSLAERAGRILMVR